MNMTPVKMFAATIAVLCGAAASNVANAAVVTLNYSNPQPITIPDSGTATPYPSPIEVAGLRGEILNVTVTLNGFSHTWPEDVGGFVRSPDGQQIELMGRRGSYFGVVNQTYTFSAASTANPGAPWTSGTYFAPLGAFNGAAAAKNGSWGLFVEDFAGGDRGSFASGWTLSITVDTFTTCAAEGYTGSKLTLCQKTCEVTQSPSTLTGLIRLYTAIYRQAPPCGL